MVTDGVDRGDRSAEEDDGADDDDDALDAVGHRVCDGRHVRQDHV